MPPLKKPRETERDRHSFRKITVLLIIVFAVILVWTTTLVHGMFPRSAL